MQSFPQDSDSPTFVADDKTHVLLALTTCVPESRHDVHRRPRTVHPAAAARDRRRRHRLRARHLSQCQRLVVGRGEGRRLAVHQRVELAGAAQGPPRRPPRQRRADVRRRHLRRLQHPDPGLQARCPRRDGPARRPRPRPPRQRRELGRSRRRAPRRPVQDHDHGLRRRRLVRPRGRRPPDRAHRGLVGGDLRARRQRVPRRRRAVGVTRCLRRVRAHPGVPRRGGRPSGPTPSCAAACRSSASSRCPAR